jgi:cytochrome c biogenesis protein
MNQRSVLLAYLRDPLALIWRIGCSRRLSLVLFSMLVLALLLSSWFPQATYELPGDSASYTRWLAAVHQRYGVMTDWARALGLFDLRGSFVFRLLLVAIAYNLLISLADQINSLFARTGELPATNDYQPVWVIEHGLASAEAMARMRGYWQRRRLWIIREEGSRFFLRLPWRQAFALLAHLGLVFALAALLLNERFGWQEARVSLAEGQSYNMARLGGLTLVADSIAVSFGEQSAPLDWQSDLSLMDQGQQLALGQVRAGHPWRFREGLFGQTGFGLAAELVAKGEQGQPELVQALPAQPGQRGQVINFSASGEEGYFAVPGRGLSFRLTYYDALPQRGIEGAVIHIQAYRSGQITPVWESFLQDQASLSLDGIEYRFHRTYYAVLQASFIPGVGMFILGLVMVLAGAAAFWVPSDSTVVLESQDRKVSARLSSGGNLTGVRLQQIRGEIERLLQA